MCACTCTCIQKDTDKSYIDILDILLYLIYLQGLKKNENKNSNNSTTFFFPAEKEAERLRLRPQAYTAEGNPANLVKTARSRGGEARTFAFRKAAQLPYEFSRETLSIMWFSFLLGSVFFLPLLENKSFLLFVNSNISSNIDININYSNEKTS